LHRRREPLPVGGDCDEIRLKLRRAWRHLLDERAKPRDELRVGWWRLVLGAGCATLAVLLSRRALERVGLPTDGARPRPARMKYARGVTGASWPW
jgi:hypothetical protein